MIARWCFVSASRGESWTQEWGEHQVALMTAMVPSGEVIREVFQLAYFIIGEKKFAIRITSEALARLEVTVTTQKKRSYYLLAGRGIGSGKASNKVSLSKTQLLQRLVYSVSERYEQDQETPFHLSVLSEDDMIIRYIKHLIKITLRRNSFYVTVGFGRILYNYPTNETIKIFEFLSQNPAGGPDDDFYRHKKKDLLGEIKRRFGKLLHSIKVEHGEERFESHSDQRRFLNLVNECLHRFSPWDSSCVLPERYDAFNDEIPQLLPQGNNIEAKQRAEVNQIHSVIHPVCFKRVVTGLRLAPPDQRQDLPSFFLAAKMGSEPPGGHRLPVDLSAEELEAVQEKLDQEGTRRGKAPAGLLRICVDHRERTRIILGRFGRARIPLKEEDELIEVWGEDNSGPLLLAALLLNGDDLAGGERRAAIVLEGGQRVSFAIRPLAAASSEGDWALLEVIYRKGGRLGWFELGRDYLAGMIGGWGQKVETWSRRPRLTSPIGALAILFIVLFLTSLFARFLLPEENEPQEEARNQVEPAQNPVPDPTNPTFINPPTEAPKNRTPQLEGQSPSPMVVKERQVLRHGVAGDLLGSVTRIYLQIEGEELEKLSMQLAVIGAIEDGERFEVAQNESDADAVLRIEITRTSPGEPPSSAVKLVKGGQVLWPLGGNVEGKPYKGRIEITGPQIIHDLASDSPKKP